MTRKIVSQRIVFDEKGQYLETKYSDNSISWENIDSEVAAQYEAQNRY